MMEIDEIERDEVERNVPNGFHHQKIRQIDWTIRKRYTNIAIIGSGAFGCVCSAQDSENNESVAVKKLSRPFNSDLDARRAYRELRLLKHFEHENVIELIEAFTPNDSIDQFNELYFVTNRMSSDLSDVVRSQKLGEDHVKFLIYQILRALKYIHSAGIVHRDLKPSNIGINEDCDLRILDFGLARKINTNTNVDEQMTGYVVTRYYRAPEVLLSWTKYTQMVDVWSVGCIMAELLTGRVLFEGDDHLDQLRKIMRICGRPSPAMLAQIEPSARNFVAQMKMDDMTIDLKQVFKKYSNEAAELLDGMLKLDPNDRLTAEAALVHPYFEEYHDPDDEPTAEPFLDVWEGQDLAVKELRQLIWDELKAPVEALD